MSVLRGLFRKQRGSLDDVTIRQVNGQSVVSAKAVSVKQPRTMAQMLRRVQWRNIQNLWSAFGDTLHPSFQSRPRTWSDYNAFMSANLTRAGVYLTAAEAIQGAAVVAGYQITRGSLISVANEIANGVGKSDISLGTLAIDEETTVADFSTAVVSNNSDYAYGDQISCFILEQQVDSVTGIPHVRVRAYELTLDGNATDTLLADEVSTEAFSVVDNKIGTGAAINGGFAYVHSRKANGKTIVSTQEIVVANSILATYQSDTKRNAAIASYGGKTSNDFLTPDLDDVEAPTPNP